MKKIFLGTSMIIIFAYLILNFNACKKETTCSSTPTYDGEVASIVNANCAISGCHGSGSTINGDFSTYSGISAKSANVKTKVSDGSMPPSGSLSDSDVQTISCWVDGGALEK